MHPTRHDFHRSDPQDIVDPIILATAYKKSRFFLFSPGPSYPAGRRTYYGIVWSALLQYNVMYVYIYTSLSLSLSLYVCMHIYIYIHVTIWYNVVPRPADLRSAAVSSTDAVLRDRQIDHHAGTYRCARNPQNPSQPGPRQRSRSGFD